MQINVEEKDMNASLHESFGTEECNTKKDATAVFLMSEVFTFSGVPDSYLRTIRCA